MEKTSGSVKLAVLGAGPKGIAIAAKRKVLQTFFQVPELIVFDRIGVGAAWSGKNGFTDGHQLLGTAPEKDIGFPYASDGWKKNGVNHSHDINVGMLAFSWQQYLVAHKGPHGFSDWIDRSRVSPTHKEWHDYLTWVWAKTEANLVEARVTKIDLNDGKWEIHSTDDKAKADWAPVLADGLVLTGTGPAKRIEGQPSTPHPCILDGRNFWPRIGSILQAARPTVAIVGKGETAASIAHALLSARKPDLFIELIGGPFYSRGEGFYENCVFTNPDVHSWPQLHPEERKTFVSHTDQGVFSQHAIDLFRLAKVDDNNFRVGPGRVININPDEHDEMRVEITIEFAGQKLAKMFNFLIVSTGFDSLGFRHRLLTERAGNAVDEAINCQWNPQDSRKYRDKLESQIDRDLSIKGLRPRLHVPMLAGFAQGPGFPNLSCLGRLSDRVLHSYCDVELPC